MCIICVELVLKKMSVYEAKMAYVEMRGGMSPQHAEEVGRMLHTLDSMPNTRAAEYLTDIDDEIVI